MQKSTAHNARRDVISLLLLLLVIMLGLSLYLLIHKKDTCSCIVSPGDGQIMNSETGIVIVTNKEDGAYKCAYLDTAYANRRYDSVIKFQILKDK